MFYFPPPRLSLSFNWLPIQQMQRLMPLRPLPRCRNMTCEHKLTFLHKFLYRWVAERCKWKRKSNNEYSVVIVEWHNAYLHFKGTGCHRSLPFGEQFRGETTTGVTSTVEKPQAFFTVEILSDTTQRIEFQVLKDCSKFAKPNQCVFFVEIRQASAYNFQSGKIIDLWYP